jgi:hypothetical protein
VRCLAPVAIAAAIAVATATGASRVVGGSVIQVQQAPWTVYLQYQSANTRFLCTGSIVDASHILTAAHCLYDDVGRLATPSQVTVRAGVSNYSSPLPTDQEQDRPVSLIRVHPGYVYAGRPTPDDVAVIALASPLDLSGPTVQAVALPTAGAAYPAGAAVAMAGFGRQSPTVQTSGPLSWMTATVDPQGECGGSGGGLTANNGITLCATSPTGAVCNGDSGSGLVTTTGTPVLVGVVSAGATGCDAGSHSLFTYTGAPEILQFVQGSDNPPTAPRETAATFLQIKWDPPLVVGNTLTCSTGAWAPPQPRFAYSFVNLTDGTVLQSGPRTTYLVPPAAIGATIVCEVTASNDGGTMLEETDPTPAVKAAPHVRILKVGSLEATRGHELKLRVSLQSPVGLWGKFAVCIVPPHSVAGKLCRSTVNADGSGGIVPFIFDVRVKATAPLGKSRLGITAVAGVSHATATAPLTISKG